ALGYNLRHTRSHENIATEFHTESGPFTLVPLPGLRSGLVCVVDQPTAAAMATLDAAELAADIERRSHSILGKITVEAGRGAFPLEGATANRVGAPRGALGGRGGPGIPPGGAPGLHLRPRDAPPATGVAVAGRPATARG